MFFGRLVAFCLLDGMEVVDVSLLASGIGSLLFVPCGIGSLLLA